MFTLRDNTHGTGNFAIFFFQQLAAAGYLNTGVADDVIQNIAVERDRLALMGIEWKYILKIMSTPSFPLTNIGSMPAQVGAVS